MKRVLKTVVVILFLIIAGVMAFFFWKARQTGNELKEKAVKLEKELRPMEVERSEIRQELDSLKADGKKRDMGVGSVVMLFTDLSEGIYTNIFPQMKEAGFIGVLAVSGTRYPGAEGCLSPEQFRKLMDAGWKCCLRWEEDADFEEWLGSCRAMLRETGIEEPKAVYFPAETYSARLEKLLDQEEFCIAIHHGEEELPLVISESGDGIWRPGAAAWNQDKASQVLGEAISQRGNLVFTVGSDSKGEQYEEEGFARMLGALRERERKDELLVTDLAGAREYRREQEEEGEMIRKEYEEKEEELKKQLEELEEKIDAVTEKYLS